MTSSTIGCFVFWSEGRLDPGNFEMLESNKTFLDQVTSRAEDIEQQQVCKYWTDKRPLSGEPGR